MAAAGYCVLVPNYRGSVGRGQAFSRSNLGDPGGAEFQDILVGVNWTIGNGIADPDGIGFTGVSYGGYLAAWAATTRTLFRAAVVVAGITNLDSFNRACNHAFCEWIAGGKTHGSNVLKIMQQRSPVFHSSTASVPTLFLNGVLDQRTPVSQALELHNAPADHGVETEFVVYQREGHDFEEKDHQMDMRLRAMSWFDLHMTARR